MVGEKRLLHKRELLRTQGVEDLNELRKLGEKRREHWSTPVIPYDRATRDHGARASDGSELSYSGCSLPTGKRSQALAGHLLSHSSGCINLFIPARHTEFSSIT